MNALVLFLERFFKLKEKGSNVRTELLAGFTTFVAVSYIIFVNPNILADAGIPKEAAFAATVYATFLTTMAMGLYANFPVAVAPGMGLNAFFTYYAVKTLGLSWQVALGAVFFSGVIFILLTVTRVRQYIIEAVPSNLKAAIVVGIGLFIAFIGLKNAGIVVASQATFVTTGLLGHPQPLLALFGLLLTAVLMVREVRGSILIGIMATTLLGMAVGAVPVPHSMKDIFSFTLPSLKPTLLKVDIMGALKFGFFGLLFTFTIVDLFDNMGTLIGLGRKARLTGPDGETPNLDKALMVDATGTVLSSLLGTSTVTSYIESAAGIAEGGRTGLTAVTTALLFLATLVCFPLVGLVPAFATAPALILVGGLMMMEVVHIDFADFTEAFPAFLTIVMMPLTFSIATGFGFGFISYTLLKACTGKHREVRPIMWIVAAAFVVNFALRSH